ncbi:DNA polymerase III subunit delta [Glycomyces dulcitolivorans]|uniref:DNA polymerase III subunit delta n=1 Tax=Glycomyces dulcitolivorans TaxID=2200759 RepID=UPI000DD37652|nr:DNA polymerase III subunit delta [Glycomyces dulcitolivorans]
MAAPEPIRLILGDDEFLAERAAAEYVKAVRAEMPGDDPAPAVNRIAGVDLNAGALNELTSPTLFGGAVVGVIESGQDVDKDTIAAVLAYAKQPAPDIYLAVCHNGGNKGKALSEGLKKLGLDPVRVSKIKRQPDRVAFVRGELRDAGASPRSASAEIADTIIQAVGSDLRELASACKQLVADTDGKITQESVAQYYSGRAEVSGFAVADATIAGDAAEALGALRWAMQVGVDAVPIADALAMAVRNLSRVASERGGAAQLAGQLGMAPWQIEKARKQARNWTADALAEAMQVCARLNGEVKGGSDDRGWALEHAILQITRLSAAGRSRV